MPSKMDREQMLSIIIEYHQITHVYVKKITCFKHIYNITIVLLLLCNTYCTIIYYCIKLI